MNAAIKNPAASLSVLSERIRERADLMAEMARRSGVDAQEPLGLLLESFREMVVALDESSVATVERIDRTIQNTRDLAIKEVHKLHAANDLAQQAIEAFRVKGMVLEKQAELATSEFMQTVEPRLIEALRSVSVVRQRQWNQRQNISGVSVAAAVLLGVFVGGYLWGGGNFRSEAPGVAAKAAVARCRAAAQPDRTSGEKWCPVKALDESQ